MRKHLNLLFFLIAVKCLAQMPDTDIWLFKIKTDKTGKVLLEDPLNFTARPGYDNQPSFSPNGKKIFYVSAREDSQADIYELDVKKKKQRRVTNTVESEYSPVLSSDGKYLTAVVVEKDSSQKIHFIDAITGIHSKKFDFDSVGYYTFLNADTVIYYKLTEPHSLRYFVAPTGEDKFICQAPVRTFKGTDRRTLLYGSKETNKVKFYKYDFLLRKAEPFSEYPTLSEDTFWHPQLGFMKSETSQLLRYDEKSKTWQVYFELASYGIKKITRFAIDASGKNLVVVDNK